MRVLNFEFWSARQRWKLVVHWQKRGSILVFQTVLAVSPIKKAVVADRHNQADRHNPIPHVRAIDFKH